MTQLGAGEDGGWLPVDFLTLQSIVFGNYSLSMGALLTCLFVGWRWGLKPALAEIERGAAMPARVVWTYLIRFACPLAVFAILLFIIIKREYF